MQPGQTWSCDSNTTFLGEEVLETNLRERKATVNMSSYSGPFGKTMLLRFHSIHPLSPLSQSQRRLLKLLDIWMTPPEQYEVVLSFSFPCFLMLSQQIPQTSTGWSSFHLWNSRTITGIGKHFSVVEVVLRLGLHDSRGSPWDQTRHVLLLLVLRDFAKLLFADSECKTKLLHKPIELAFDHRGKEKLFSGVNYEQAYSFFQANVTNHTG